MFGDELEIIEILEHQEKLLFHFGAIPSDDHWLFRNLHPEFIISIVQGIPGIPGINLGLPYVRHAM